MRKAIIEPEKVIAPTAAPIDISIRLANLIFPEEPKLKTSGLIKADIATCHMSGGGESKIVRYERTGGKTFREKKIRCRSGFSNELQVHFLFLGLRNSAILTPLTGQRT